jgi:DNA-binding GntR family transcriptional regulator
LEKNQNRFLVWQPTENRGYHEFITRERAMEKGISKIKEFNDQPISLTDQVSRILVGSILQGVLKPGDQLVETELQKQLGVSRSPLREAFRDLEKKGLVVIVPRKGTFVKIITRKGIYEHYPVQAALEGLAAREAFLKMTPEDFKKMEKEYDAMVSFIKALDANAFEEHHELFHGIFIDASENELLISTIRNLRLQGTLYRYFHRHSKDYARKSLLVHRKILDLFQNKKTDPDKLEQTVRHHIEIFAARDAWNL